MAKKERSGKNIEKRIERIEMRLKELEKITHISEATEKLFLKTMNRLKKVK